MGLTHLPYVESHCGCVIEDWTGRSVNNFPASIARLRGGAILVLGQM